MVTKLLQKPAEVPSGAILAKGLSEGYVVLPPTTSIKEAIGAILTNGRFPEADISLVRNGKFWAYMLMKEDPQHPDLTLFEIGLRAGDFLIVNHS